MIQNTNNTNINIAANTNTNSNILANTNSNILLNSNTTTANKVISEKCCKDYARYKEEINIPKKNDNVEVDSWENRPSGCVQSSTEPNTYWYNTNPNPINPNETQSLLITKSLLKESNLPWIGKKNLSCNF